MRRPLPCVARCSLLLAACSPFASAAVLCCPFALPGLLRWLPGWLLPDGVLQQRPCQQQLCHGVHSQQRPAQWRPQTSSSSATTASLPATSSRWLSTTAPLPASLSHGRGAQVLGAGGCCRLARDAGVGCWIRLTHGLVRRSCNSPRALILVLGTSGAHWPARWPQFVLTEHGPKS